MVVSMIQNYGATESETRGGDHELSHAAITQRMEKWFDIKYMLHTTKSLTQDFL